MFFANVLVLVDFFEDFEFCLRCWEVNRPFEARGFASSPRKCATEEPIERKCSLFIQSDESPTICETASPTIPRIIVLGT